MRWFRDKQLGRCSERAMRPSVDAFLFELPMVIYGERPSVMVIYGERPSVRTLIMAKTVTSSFLAEIERPTWTPIRRAYMIDSGSSEVEITDKVEKFDRILWQISQQYQLNDFAASNCTLHLKNEDEEFDVDNASNYFVTELSQSQDGYRVPVKIEVGFSIGGIEELISLFYGHIVDIDVNTIDDLAIIELQCVSKILRDASTDNLGDPWTSVTLYGGNTYCYVNDVGGLGRYEYSLAVDNNPSGNFPSAFPDAGYIRIDEEKIWYGSLGANTFEGLIRGQLGTTEAAHDDDSLVEFLLWDGSQTYGKRFQFPLYPLSHKSVSACSSSDGSITILEADNLLGQYGTNRYGWFDYDIGILTLGDEPSDSSSVVATLKTCFRQILYHDLVKELIDNEGFGTSQIEDATLKYYLNIPVPSSYGRVITAYSGGTLTNLGLTAKTYSMCIGGNDDYLYLGVGRYLVQYDGEHFNLLDDMGSGNDILRMASDGSDNIYMIVGDIDGGSLRDLKKWNGTTTSTLQSGICAYFEPMGGYDGGQWRGFSVDTTNNVIWFLYDDTATIGVAKCNFDGTGLTKYSRSASHRYRMDFVDRNGYIDFFYHDGSGNMKYDTLTKSSGSWTANGNLATGMSDPSPIDIVYNSYDDKIYMNVLYFTVPTTSGTFGYVTPDSVPISVIETYATAGSSRPSRYCGGVIYNDYAWYIKGTMLADGVNDEGNGHLYRCQNGSKEHIGALGYRADDNTHIKGHAAVMAARSSDDALFFILADQTSLGSSTHGFILKRYSPYIVPLLPIADINNASMWDILSELASLVNYELGVTGDGDVFWRPRTSIYTYLNGAHNATVTTISTDGTNMDKFESSGIIETDIEVIEYTGKTSNSFTGCTRGARGSTAASHSDETIIRKIVQVMVNREHEKNLKYLQKFPNWDDIYNVISIQYGDKMMAFNYDMAGDSYAGSSEETYGRRQLDFSNRFLTSDDGAIAETIGWRYYNHYNQRWSLFELETKWQPQLDLADPISIKQAFRVLADYTIGMIRRIEVNMSEFYMRLTVTTSPALDAPTIYDA